VNIKDQKDLKKLIALCRTLGVDAIEVDGIKMSINLNFNTPKSNRAISKAIKSASKTTIAPGGITEDTKIDMPNELTPEQLLFYSATDHTASDQQ
jgi:hypothetical protein